MPRPLNERKYNYAKTLLESNMSIRNVQSELKRIFGSAISPNRLLELKQSLHQIQPSTPKSPQKFADVSFRPVTSDDFRFFAEQFNISMDKLTKEIQSQQILIEELFAKIQKQEKEISEKGAKSEASSPNFPQMQPSDMQVAVKCQELLIELQDYLKRGETDILQIQQDTMIPIDLLEILLNHLEITNLVQVRHDVTMDYYQLNEE